MLDFYFIADEQPSHLPSAQLKYVGGMGEEEFEMAQQARLIEGQADYYGKFRWSGEQVRHKVDLLANCPFHASTALDAILKQAEAAGMGLIAFGD